MTHHSVMTSSLRIKISKIDKFGDFSCDIDYNSRTDVFRYVISLIINQCDTRRPHGASGGHKVSASRSASKRSARLCIYIYIYIYIQSNLRDPDTSLDQAYFFLLPMKIFDTKTHKKVKCGTLMFM